MVLLAFITFRKLVVTLAFSFSKKLIQKKTKNHTKKKKKTLIFPP